MIIMPQNLYLIAKLLMVFGVSEVEAPPAADGFELGTIQAPSGELYDVMVPLGVSSSAIIGDSTVVLAGNQDADKDGPFADWWADW